MLPYLSNKNLVKHPPIYPQASIYRLISPVMLLDLSIFSPIYSWLYTSNLHSFISSSFVFLFCFCFYFIFIFLGFVLGSRIDIIQFNWLNGCHCWKPFAPKISESYLPYLQISGCNRCLLRKCSWIHFHC